MEEERKKALKKAKWSLRTLEKLHGLKSTELVVAKALRNDLGVENISEKIRYIERRSLEIIKAYSIFANIKFSDACEDLIGKID